jgi:hypothetical protein
MLPLKEHNFFSDIEDENASIDNKMWKVGYFSI